MDILRAVWQGMKALLSDFGGTAASAGTELAGVYTSVARIVFVVLAAYILLRAIWSLIKSKHPSEVWAYFHMENGRNIPVTHWENSIGRAKSNDIVVDAPSVSRSHGTLTRDKEGRWTYMDLGSKNGAVINGKDVAPYEPVRVETGDEILIGGVICTLFPISLQEHLNNLKLREQDTKMPSPWSSFVALTLFQAMTVLQLRFSLGERYTPFITISFVGLAVLMWLYVIVLRSLKRRAFEMETIAFFLTTLSLAVVSTCLPDQVFKQFLAAVLGVAVFLVMCWFLRDLKRTTAVKPFLYGAAALLLIINLIFATVKFGAANWIQIGGVSLQPSEVVKVAFIWVGAATMNELFRQKNMLAFTIFSLFCFGCLAKMGDFGTALIFFTTFLVISYLRSGDFTKLIGIVGVALVAGLLVLRFRSYVAKRVLVWGHVWENADALGYQQTRTMSAAASGGLFGLGAGKGWLHNVAASQTDLVFGVVSEEWGLIIALMAVLAIVTLSFFAWRSIMSGRSTYYMIAGCAASSLFLVQTILNVFGSLDLLPLTGVTFPFLSYGGTSMVASWALLAFLKAADTRQNASLAVQQNNDEGLEKEGAA